MISTGLDQRPGRNVRDDDGGAHGGGTLTAEALEFKLTVLGVGASCEVFRSVIRQSPRTNGSEQR